MLIRISGGHDGIKGYLENGHKQGREFARDELDERVILAGDLDLADQVIQGLQIAGERYLHITLAFKEDEISNETLSAIANDFRRFMFSAYRDDEYCFYAEAHIPKIKSYEHQSTGEVVERKPHIHIVVPKVNLRSGGALNPFGLVERNEQYIDAAQEHINNRYGLASPKDHRRVVFTDASDMISRYKADSFRDAGRDLKKAILSTVIERDITSYEVFAGLVAEFGVVRTRRSGSAREYLNVKPFGNAKGVNLKDYAFSRGFIELPKVEKQQAMAAEVVRRYEVHAGPRKDTSAIEAALEEWIRFRSKEVKYLNSGNKRQYRAYHSTGATERSAMLAVLERRFYTKYPQPVVEPERFTGADGFELSFASTPGATTRLQSVSLDGVARSEVDTAREYVSRKSQVDRFGSPSVQSRALGPLASFEATLSLGSIASMRDAEPVWRNAPIHDQQERYHDPAKCIGKNPLGHQYGLKRVEQWRSREAARGAPGDRGGFPGGAAWNSFGSERRDARSDGAHQFADGPDRQHNAGQIAGIGKAESLNSLRRLPGGALVRSGRTGFLLLPNPAPPQLGNGRAKPDHTVRRTRNRQSIRGTGRVNDSVVGQVARDFAERRRRAAAGALPEFEEVKRYLDPQRLLAELARSHGVMVEKYSVTASADGSPRIRCGHHNLNVCDFLTKEVRLPWTEAATYLRRVYARQLDRYPHMPPRVRADRTLWSQFQDQRRAPGGLRARLAAQIASERARQAALRQRLALATSVTKTLPSAERKSALSVARKQYLALSDELRATIRAERAPLRLPVADQYRRFLQERAQAGDSRALAELRRRSDPAPLGHQAAVGHILPVREDVAGKNELLYSSRKLRYRVQHNGEVFYARDGRRVMEDTRSSVKLLQMDRLTIEASLRLAQAKFGDQLKLSGPAEFRIKAARIAAESGLNVKFDNKDAEHIREQRAAELFSQRLATRLVLEGLTRPQTTPVADSRSPLHERSASAPHSTNDDKDIER